MNDMNKLLKTMTLDYFAKGNHKIAAADLLNNKEALLLDVRSEAERETLDIKLDHFIPVLTIPLDKLPERLEEIPKDKTIGLFCSGGNRSTMAFFYLQTLGYDKVRNIDGGYTALIPEIMPGKVFKKLG
ncbi:MAG: rhodanese-like domain-containing protein [Spirochaetales bacterium]|nr:rhodanese-like domain-containing protein [Spirochaetales bacterium]